MTKITDENDNLIEADDWEVSTVATDDWEETPGGYAKIAIDLDDEVVNQLVDYWAEDNLSPPSQEIYIEDMQAGFEQAKALHRAVINEVIIYALTRKIKEAEDADKS